MVGLGRLSVGWLRAGAEAVGCCGGAGLGAWGCWGGGGGWAGSFPTHLMKIRN